MRMLTPLAALAGIYIGCAPLIAAQSPDLAILNLQAPAAFTNGPNPAITIQWAVTNQGGSLPPDSNWADAIYFSTNQLLDATATLLQSSGLYSDWLATGSYALTYLLDLPITNSGTWYLHVKTDDGDQIVESIETNNVATVSFTATILPPDLRPLALICPATLTSPPIPYVTLAWGVTNQGTGPADGFAHPWVDAVFVSTNSYRDGTEQQVDYRVFTNKLESVGSYWVTNRVRLPIIQTGNYYLIVETMTDERLLESDTNNNTIAVPLLFQATPPDLAPVLFQAAAEVTSTPNPRLTFAWGVTNQGIGPAIGRVFTVNGSFDGWLDGFYLSTNATWDQTATLIGFWEETNALPVGASYYRTNTFTLPVVASGTYYLFLVTDPFNDLQESNFSNNTASRTIVADIRLPDLAPFALIAPTVVTGAPGTLVPIVIGVTNQGVGSAIPSDPSYSAWFDWLELWTTPAFPAEPWVTSLVQRQRTEVLAEGDSYWLTNSLTIPEGGGQFTLAFETDARGNLLESNETNNRMASPIAFIIPPRLERATVENHGLFWANALGTFGFNYTLQASSNLVNWVDLSTFKYINWPTYISDPAAANYPQRFYRLVPAPAGP